MSDACARAALGVPDDVEMSEEECQAALEQMHTVLSEIAAAMTPEELAARSDDADEPPEWVFESVTEKPGDEDCGEWVAF